MTPLPRRAGLPPVRAALTLLAGALLAAGCSTSSPEAPGTIESWRAELVMTDRAFCAAAAADTAQAFYDFMVDDAVWLPTGSEPVLGREAVRDTLRQSPGARLVWEPQAADVARSGELGYTWGLYQVQDIGPDGRQRVLSRGKYTTIWRRQRDGSWRAVLDIGNPNRLPLP